MNVAIIGSMYSGHLAGVGFEIDEDESDEPPAEEPVRAT